jgi:HPt (histidine-containing phosphotransfer) domain-containing protein
MNSDLDLSYLEEVTGGSSEMIVEMLQLFINDTPDQLSNIESGVKEADWDAVRAEAHKLKPTFQYVGMDDTHLLVAEVETKARNREQLERIPELVDSIKRNFNSALVSFESKIEELSS